MDFYAIKEREGKNGVTEVYPDFRVTRSEDLMVQGKAFYAVWDDQKGLWSTDEYDVARLIDAEILAHKDRIAANTPGFVKAKLLQDFASNAWMQFRSYVGHISDSARPLDEQLTFSNTEVKKSDHVSKRLPYPLSDGDFSAWDSLVSVLYDPSERAKLEWAIGAVVAGDARDIQKFLVLYGPAGAGKSTVLNIIQKLFAGYYTTFEAKALTGQNNSFATEVFRGNPLVAIQHDGDLSRIEDNTKLNSIVSHEEMTMNEKYKPSYMARINAFLFMGTNKPVKITDAKSGIIRRLIDVQPSGNKLEFSEYHRLMKQIDFQLGAIAKHCLDVYLSMGPEYYDGYRPMEMMLQTDVFYNFVEYHFDVFKEQDGVTLKQAYELYKQYCDETLVEYRIPQYKFREELKNYFTHFEERTEIDGVRLRSWYSGFELHRFTSRVGSASTNPDILVLDQTVSGFDERFAGCPAQLATSAETPRMAWDQVETTLDDVDTSELHYVRPGEHHIVIDFDLTSPDGGKDLDSNLRAAAIWPPTYAELSKSGSGVHLHYDYDGDPASLSRIFAEGIEIKVFTGHSSLRRKLTYCNDLPIAELSSGLPLKEKKVIDAQAVKSERSLRHLIERNLRKETHPGTKPSIDFIHKILEDAYDSGLVYDLTDMRGAIMAFANNSTNQSLYCLGLVQKMKFASEEQDEKPVELKDNEKLVFFDVEVFPNLFVVCWKYEGQDQIVRMINPKPAEVEALLGMKLVGFNNRRYDNHILYAAVMGYDNKALYDVSQKIISNAPGAAFREAYDLSYADIYDFSSKKQSLKKFELELGLNHLESHHPWDQEVDQKFWMEVADYCANDVQATEATFKARKDDFVAREVLAELSGLSVNQTTQKHTAQIIFQGDKKAQEKFIYTDLSEMFEGYVYDFGKSTYRGEEVGEGGYVYAEPGFYEEVALLDVASMHPTSIELLDLFGPYTQNFSDLKLARLAIKRGDYESARAMLDGRLKPYLKDESTAEALSYALKIVINIVYGLTSAKFDNPFRDRRNKDNIVAKRGALFMIDLKHFVQEKGFTVAHIKTDSIKIPNATPEIIDQVMEFGNDYGYTFEHEATYEKLALVNDAVYVAKSKKGREPGHWSATGKQFQHPYVFKTLFTHEEVEFKDLCEFRSVTTAMYMDFNGDDTPMATAQEYQFVGKFGLFVPVTQGGAHILREKDGKYYAVAGTKGHRWLEADSAADLGFEDYIDMSYFKKLVDDAIDNLSKYGDVEWLLS